MFNFFKKRKKIVVSSKKVFGACFVLVLLCGTFATILLPNVAFAGLSDYISGTELARDFFAVFFSYISEALLRITSLVLYVSGIILKYIIEISIVKMGAIIDSGGVRSAWSTFRDIANMSFIFIILYIAISTILGTGVNMRKTLVRVVIVALLLNFSFFFTKIVVDASNILTIGFYNQIINTPCTPDGGQPAGDLGSAFMCQMGLATVWNADIINDVAGNAIGLEIGTILVRGVMGSLFFLIAAFVFLAASLMFLARLVTFIFLFTLSPLAFGAMALPNDEYSNKWKEPLIKNSIFAPAFMLAIWAALKVLGGINQILFPNGRNLNLAEALIGREGGVSQNAGQVFMNYAIVIGMIIGALMVAEKFGAYGAGAAIKMLNNSRKSIQGAIGRQTIGRAGNALDNKISKSDSRLGRFANSDLGREIRGLTTGAAAKAKFGSKTDFKKYQKDKEKEDKDYAKEVREQRKAKDEFKYTQLQQQVTRTNKALVEQVEKAGKSPTEVEIEAKIAKDTESLSELNAQQKTDERLLADNKGTPGYSIIKNRIDDRAVEIKKLEDKIASGPEAVQLKQIQDATKKLTGTLEKEAAAAQTALKKFTEFNQAEAEKLFTTSGKEDESEEKGRKMGLSDRDLEDFMENERTKYVKEVKELMEGDKSKNKKPDPVRVQLMRDAGEYSKIRGTVVSAIRKSLREGDGKKTKDIVQELMKSEGIEGKGEEEGGGGDKDGGGGGNKGGDKGGKGK